MHPLRTRLLAAVILMTGCPKPIVPPTLSETAAGLAYGTTPRLPSPQAGTYSRMAYDSPDAVLHLLLEGRQVDASLMGASAGLAFDALEGIGGITRWELREALWAAGWPYPVQEARGWSTSVGDAPPAEAIEWLAGLPEDDDMALVRARGTKADAWVGMRARPTVDLGPLPRVVALGAKLTLPVVPGATWQLADASGRLLEGDLETPATMLLTTTGEWLVQIKRGREELARFPVYVGVDAPDAPLLRRSESSPPISDAHDAEDHATTMLRHVRDEYGLRAWLPDPLVSAAARSFAQSPERGAAQALNAVGVHDPRVIAWQCTDATVEDCIDRWVWDPRQREALLATEPWSMGIHAGLDTGGLRLTVLLVGAS